MNVLTSTKTALKLGASLAFATLGLVATAPAQASPFAGGPDDGFIGCDGVGECNITLDELGNISGKFGGFFGPYDVTLTNIAATVDPSYAGLEVTSYLVVGKGSSAPLRLTAGAIGICDEGVSADGLFCTGSSGDKKGDVLIFKPGIIDAGGYGHTIIDFLSDTEGPFAWATEFNVLEVGPEGNNGATYQTGATGFYPNGVICPGDPTCSPANERMTYYIKSDAVPEPLTMLGAGIAIGFGSFFKRKIGKNNKQNKA